MSAWNSFGISTIGPGHIKNGIPNQDSFAEKHSTSFDCITVSDGVGSCPKSDIGSAMSCRAVLETISRFAESNGPVENSTVLDSIKKRFFEMIAPFDARECSATCLFAVRWNERIILALLGDGLAAVLMKDGSVHALSDDKTNGFSNLVSALSPRVEAENWKLLELPEDDCSSVLLCTDGISDDLSDPEGFVKGFLLNCITGTIENNIRTTREMLLNWPVPKHSDDKTIACMYRVEVENA